ncbi:uncharacterized protein NECHADRAFT_72861 [Fusarium vanettenii 77-13-4]|uniref:Methyltransferase n=1 Tax=Fusarium vanettenii (strain ATCC MYA-4622 / CBS 123669 / FGSC 9596 / NRRL 45880 / 77-13-4) TaxID=660122 RepID=C7ZIS2_FUSV7|nr:uncharacterized protein NECHADRAFT_72861 [Fusarium vanettenii 77-13-4]EEU36135.1 hypothetical protein NECHADRAFT_72861 [Fusarium vanettenii 77-13-4]
MADTTSPAAASSPKSQKSDTPQAADAAPIEVGDDNPADDGDSALGTEASSSSASISSSILDYRTMHGRTYHSERGTAQYWAPNDALQNEVMDIHHHLLTIASEDKLHHAPINKDIEKALDVGTGTGIWAIDFADEFSATEVIGTDLSPIQPSWVPPNLKFEIEDCTRPWTFRPDTFDYIHMRYLVGSVKDWNGLFEQAFLACKPGGWVESFEGVPVMQSDDGSVSDDSAMAGWGKTFIKAGKKLKRSFTVVDDNVQEEGMAAAGLVDIESRIFKIPIGRWPKDQNYRNIGLFAQEVLEGDVEGHVLHVADLAWGWSKEQVTIYCAKLRKEIRSGKHHPYYRIKIVYGRKPE